MTNAKLIVAAKIKDPLMAKLKQEVKTLAQKKIIPHLVVIQVGDDHASTIYIKHKAKIAKELGIKFTHQHLPKQVSYQKLKSIIENFNRDLQVSAIIIQEPLPIHLQQKPISLLINPDKDGDGFHPLNQGINLLDIKTFAPQAATPQGIIALLKAYDVEFSGKSVAIIGRSNIVGKPLAYLFLKENSSVTILHTYSSRQDYLAKVALADIIVLATGTIDPILPEQVKKNVIIIDVGINRLANGKIRGDVNHHQYLEKASLITPVPGGVGPMTVLMLMTNTIKLAKKQLEVN